MPFLRALVLRAARTAAQTAVATIPVSAAVIQEVDWSLVGGASALAAVLSALTSIATGLPEAE